MGAHALRTCLCAALLGGSGAALGLSLPLQVRESAGVARRGEVLQSGVPLPAHLGITSTRGLGVMTSGGAFVPAELKVLSRWSGGPAEASAPIQWLLVSFPAEVAAHGSASYFLVSGAPELSPPEPLRVTHVGEEVLVDTGAGRFLLGGHGLFTEIRGRDGALLASSGETSSTFEGATAGSDRLRAVRVEHAGPLTATVTVTGTYGHLLGGGAVSWLRRYQFRAGSPTAIVRHVVSWEGTLNGRSWWATGKTPTGFNVIEGSRIRDGVDLAFAPTDALAVGSFGSSVEAPHSGQEIALRTLLKEQAGGLAARWQPRRYEVTSGPTVLEAGSRPGVAAAGELATGGMLVARGAPGSVAIAIRQMHLYEPQALRLTAGGKLAIDVADDRFRLAYRQGLFATLAVSALPADVERAELDRLVWAPLNRPLRALPSAACLNAAGALTPLPDGPLPQGLEAYDTHLEAMLDNTLRKAEHEGLHGLLTTGLWPRYWAEPGSTPSSPAGEIGNGDWAQVFMGTTWTDYYSTTHTAGIWALRSGKVEYLDELVVPAALRTLHTQIIQGAPDDTDFYIGQGSAGYSGYRSDFNSKHHYWDNLFLHYFLTGDESVVALVRRGGRAQMTWVKGGHGGVVNAPSALWVTAWRFLGATVPEPDEAAEFREMFLASMRRWIDDHYLELTYRGQTYGFRSDEAAPTDTFFQDSPWTVAGFELNNLYWFMRMTGDAPVGANQLRPSRVFRTLAKTYAELFTAPDLARADGTLLGGDGTLRGKVARNIAVTFTGPRLGGAVETLNWADQTGAWLLFPDDKPYMAEMLAVAASLGADSSVQRMADDAIQLALERIGTASVLGKLGGLRSERLHSAVALRGGATGSCELGGPAVALERPRPPPIELWPLGPTPGGHGGEPEAELSASGGVGCGCGGASNAVAPVALLLAAGLLLWTRSTTRRPAPARPRSARPRR